MQGGFSTYGFRSPEVWPGLWGGFATHLYLAPEASVLPVSSSASIGAASLFNVLANGVEWAIRAGGARPGLTCAVLGCGPRGLACLLAARLAGIDRVVLTGLPSDADRLAFAEKLGADGTIVVGDDDVAGQVVGVLGAAPDLVIDTTPLAVRSVADAISMVALRGTVVLAGLKGEGAVGSVEVDTIITKQVAIRGVLSRTAESAQVAIKIIESGRAPLDEFASHAFALDQAELAVRAVAGEADGRPLHVRIEPTR
jgi:alcohol dehydrogenase